MEPARQIVTNGAGIKKVILAPYFADLPAAVTVAKAEVLAKTADINDKFYANKRYKDF